MMETGLRDLQDAFFDDIGNFIEVLKAMDSTLGALIMVKNTESRYVFMSRALCDAIGFSQYDDVVGKTDYDLFPKIIAETYRQNDLTVFRENRPLINEIHAGGFIEGVPKWFFSSKFPLRNRKGEVVGLFTTNRLYEGVMGADDDLNRLLPAVEFMHNHYPDKISNAELAGACGISESHFMRLFKYSFNLTSRTFLEQVRMFHAIEAIKHSSTSIAEIAVNCGFYDHSSFVKRFKTFAGTTPLSYRRGFRSNQVGEAAMALPRVS